MRTAFKWIDKDDDICMWLKQAEANRDKHPTFSAHNAHNSNTTNKNDGKQREEEEETTTPNSVYGNIMAKVENVKWR